MSEAERTGIVAGGDRPATATAGPTERMSGSRPDAEATTIERLTTEAYWDAKYTDEPQAPLQLEGFRSLTNARLYAAMSEVGLDGKRVLEVGAGDSQWLTFLAARHPDSTFAGIDYSEPGCERLARRARAEGVEIEVHRADLFAPNERLLRSFDVVYSLGVVEHFDDLAGTLRAMARLLRPGGRLFTEIPNMAGVLGALTRRMNRSVYELHNPHDLAALREGHERAGLSVERSGYIGAIEFGVLSSCVDERSGTLTRQSYLWLSRLGKLAALFELRVMALPPTPTLSPLIYCIARRDGTTTAG